MINFADNRIIETFQPVKYFLHLPYISLNKMKKTRLKVSACSLSEVMVFETFIVPEEERATFGQGDWYDVLFDAMLTLKCHLVVLKEPEQSIEPVQHVRLMNSSRPVSPHGPKSVKVSIYTEEGQFSYSGLSNVGGLYMGYTCYFMAEFVALWPI